MYVYMYIYIVHIYIGTHLPQVLNSLICAIYIYVHIHIYMYINIYVYIYVHISHGTFGINDENPGLLAGCAYQLPL